MLFLWRRKRITISHLLKSLSKYVMLEIISHDFSDFPAKHSNFPFGFLRQHKLQKKRKFVKHITKKYSATKKLENINRKSF